MTIATETEAPPPIAGPVPSAWREVTAPWLADALATCPVFRGLELDGIEVESLGAGRGFAADLARIRLIGKLPAGAPETLIAKVAAERGETRDLLTEFGAYDREVRFYRELAPGAGIPVPRCYAAIHGEEGRFALLLEDLAPAEGGDQIQGASLERHEQVLRALAELHARWWNSDALLARSWLLADLDVERIRELFVAALDGFCEQIAPNCPSLARVARELGRMPQGYQLPKHPRPFTLVHGDFRLDNVFFPSPEGGRFGLVDWQTTAIGAPSADVASWLILSLRTEQRREQGRHLLAVYHRALSERGVTGYPLARLRVEIAFVILFQVMGLVISGSALALSEGRGRDLMHVLTQRVEAALDDLRVPFWLPWLRRLLIALGALRRWSSRLRGRGAG